jgi:Tol biopolymer transport system component
MLAAGTTLGPYRILAPLGAGGMGEVYRARDTRLRRDVAIKVLPAHLAEAPELRARFEREARTISQLNHPHICTLFDVGHQAGIDYLVMELLEGETLARRIEKGALPVAELLVVGGQIASALARAHQAGVVHRDLKPGNVMLTKGGAKLMDFGLARAHVLAKRPAVTTQTPTASEPLTAEGMIVGTLQYMAPEQLQGREADARADLWALGCVLYEMATGERAFAGESPASLIAAILTGESRALTELRPVAPPALERVVRRCLAKDPEERFQSASDLAFELDAIGRASGEGRVVPAPAPRWRRWLGPAVLLALIAGAVLVTYVVTRRRVTAPVPLYERVTFRRGYVGNLARFTPDGQSVLYNAIWTDGTRGIFSQRLSTPEARTVREAGFIWATAGNEMAIIHGGTLARLPLDGGTPRDIADSVTGADWSRDGSRFVIGRISGDRQRLESPIGRTLLEWPEGARFRLPRLSPRGDLVALIDNPLGPVDPYQGDVATVDAKGTKRVLAKGWRELDGIAWSPDGREVWFTGTRLGGRSKMLYAVDLAGHERLLARAPGDMKLMDIAPDGRVLMILTGFASWEMRGRLAGDSAERDLSWFDGTANGFLAPDGTRLLFQEEYGGGGDSAATYLRSADGSPPVRIADMRQSGVSPDWKWALCYSGYPRITLRLVPLGAGEPRTLQRGSLDNYAGVMLWHPDGKRILFTGREPGQPVRLFAQDVPDGAPRAIGPEGIEWNGVLSADGVCMTGRPEGSAQPWAFYPIAGGVPRPIRGLAPRENPLVGSSDGRWLFVRVPDSRYPIRIMRLDLRSGRREPWLELTPPSRDGVFPPSNAEISLTPDGRFYTYDYGRAFSDLYVVSGLK